MSSTDGPTAASGPSDPLLTKVLEDRYRLEAVLGRGGTGTVYRALDTRLERHVAIKVLRDSGEADTARFREEVRTLARCAHPNLVRLLDAGEFDRHPFLVMDLIEGPALAQRLLTGALSGEESAKVGIGIAAALAYVHEQGIIHRDVKPANILLDGSGSALLADFGIARILDTTGITAVGYTLGTPAYLAPEQIQGADIGPAVDIYALGLMLLECLSGHRAFEGTAAEITAARLQRDPVIPSELGAAWRWILRSMTARAPTERPTASAVATYFTDFAHDQLLASTPVGVISPASETTAVLRDRRANDVERVDLTETIVDPTRVAASVDKATVQRPPSTRRRGLPAISGGPIYKKWWFWVGLVVLIVAIQDVILVNVTNSNTAIRPTVPVQIGDSGVPATNSFTKATVLPNDVKVGDAVVFVIIAYGALGDPETGRVTKVLSPIGTFVRYGSSAETGKTFDIEIWVCLKASTAGNTVTVTTAQGSPWAAQATEWPGGATILAGGSRGYGTSTALTPAVSAAEGQIVVVGADGNSPLTGFNSGSGPTMTDYNAGAFAGSTGEDVAWGQMPTNGTATPTWTQAKPGRWSSAGVVFSLS